MEITHSICPKGPDTTTTHHMVPIGGTLACVYCEEPMSKLVKAIVEELTIESITLPLNSREAVMCDYCKLEDGKNVRAVVDTKSKGGPWAYMCESHNERYGCGIAGLTNQVNV